MDYESSYDIFDSAIRQALHNYYDVPYYEDLYQECYMKILDVLKNNTYEPIYNLYGYAYKIARNAISTFTYHSSKLVTLKTETFPDISIKTDFDSSLILNDILTQILEQYKDFLPNYTKEDLINLLMTPNKTNNLLFNILRGEIIWRLATYQ